MSQAHLFEMERGGAELSACGRFRYLLWRSWGDGSNALFLMLHPSTADAECEDPTIRRCKKFARTWGCGGIVVANLFAYRATSPKDLESAGFPVEAPGDDGRVDALISEASRSCSPVVVAWGAVASIVPERARTVLSLLIENPFCFGTTKDGHPRHPLKSGISLVPYTNQVR